MRSTKSTSFQSAPSLPERRRFGRQLWSAAALLACGAGAGAWWYWNKVRRDAAVGLDKELPKYGFEVVKTYDHDPQAFTQGLLFDDGVLYESTGHEGQSTLRRVEVATGKVLDHVRLHQDLFGEGLALVEDELFQLTWKHEVCLVYDKKTLREKRRLKYSGQGWGLTFDGTHLILSDGSDVLRFLDPRTFRVVKKLNVTKQGEALEKLNELEYINGEVWANVWYRDWIARIDPKTGKVVSQVDLTSLWNSKDRDIDEVLNGIAHDAKKDRLFVTGKNWPKLYEIKLIAPKQG